MCSKWTLESAAASRGPALHPLAGADYGTLLAHFRENGPFDSRSRHQRVLAWASLLARLPFYQLERGIWGKAVREHVIEKPPIFLIGHWRSGTTHLHNLLSRDPQFGYMGFAETALPWNMLGKKAKMARAVISAALPETRGTDNVRMAVDEPQEEEMALGNMNSIGYYNNFYYPQDAERQVRKALFFEGATSEEVAAFEEAYSLLVRKMSYAKGGKQMLFKNPPSTTRIPMLKRLFPEAKFVHIVRDPYEVYSSMVAKFPRLYNAFAWQRFDNVDIRGMVLRTYRDLMQTYLKDRESIAPADLLETSYERITADPMREIETFYDQFGISNREAGLAAVSEYSKSVADYKRNRHQIPEAEREQIRDMWSFAFEAFGYPKTPAES